MDDKNKTEESQTIVPQLRSHAYCQYSLKPWHVGHNQSPAWRVACGLCMFNQPSMCTVVSDVCVPSSTEGPLNDVCVPSCADGPLNNDVVSVCVEAILVEPGEPGCKPYDCVVAIPKPYDDSCKVLAPDNDKCKQCSLLPTVVEISVCVAMFQTMGLKKKSLPSEGGCHGSMLQLRSDLRSRFLICEP